MVTNLDRFAKPPRLSDKKIKQNLKNTSTGNTNHLHLQTKESSRRDFPERQKTNQNFLPTLIIPNIFYLKYIGNYEYGKDSMNSM